MSKKIDIRDIVSGHFGTLTDNTTNKISYIDLMIFFLLPVSLGAVSFLFSFNINKDLAGLLVNFGSILTALLLSVLVLVYDQESKLKTEEPAYALKKRFLKELYFNISFSVLGSISLVLFCFIHTAIPMDAHSLIAIGEHGFDLKYGTHIVTPIVIFLSLNLFLNIIMIVKRLHTLLITVS